MADEAEWGCGTAISLYDGLDRPDLRAPGPRP